MSDKNNSINFLIGVIGGAAAGMILALLLAPKSGKETRKELKEKIDELNEKYSPELVEVKNQALSSLDKIKCLLERKFAKFNEAIKAEQLAKAKNKETPIYEI